MKRIKAALTAVAIFSISNLSHAAPLGSTFTYQGTLAQNGVDVTDICDFNFGLWDASAGGMAVAVAVDVLNVSVTDGRFTVELDFGGGAFNGDARWLEISVACPAGGGLTTLSPRQQLTPSPNALFAASAGAMEWSGLLNVPPDIANGDDVDDADADPTNELQDLDLSANTLSLTGDASPVDLSAYLDNTDDQTLAEVLAQGNNAGGASISNVGTTTTGSLTVTGLDCTANANGGALTADGGGVVSCSDDDAGGGGGNTLDAAYDQGGAGAGRTITADAGAVNIDGPDGLALDSGSLLQTPGTPSLAGSLVIGTAPYRVHVSGRYAYVLDNDTDDLKVIDVSDPGAPSLVGSIGVGTFPESVDVSGRYAYVVDSIDFKVIDVSDPSAPSLAGSLGVGAVPLSVHVSGRYAYVVDADSDDLKVIDVSDPGAPSLAGSLGIGLGPRAVYVSGRYAYVVDSSSDDFRVIDVSDPSMPSLAGSLGLGAGAVPQSVYVSGRYAYVVDTASDDLKVIDVSDPGAPSLAGSLAIGASPLSVYVSGRYAFVVDSASDDLKVIDVSGAEVTSLMAHSLDAGNIQVRNDVIAQGQLQVTGGVSVGSGGLFTDGNVGVSGTIAIANDIAPVASPANLVQLYAEDVAASSELRVRDEAGNVTTLSPHNFSLLGKPSEPMAWSFYSENDHGKINVDMLRAMRLIERLSGEKLVHTEMKGSGNAEISKFAESTFPGPTASLLDTVYELMRQNEELRADNKALTRRVEALEMRSDQKSGSE